MLSYSIADLSQLEQVPLLQVQLTHLKSWKNRHHLLQKKETDIRPVNNTQ